MLKKLFPANIAGLCAIAVYCLLASVHSEAYGLELTNWKVYTAIVDVISADVDSRSRIWAGSAGGVFCYNPKDGSGKEFRSIDALMSLSVTSVSCNPERQEVYIGHQDGNIDICTEDFKFSHIMDIKNSGFSNPKINGIVFRGNLAYIAGGFGLAVFDMDARVFRETVQRIGTFATNTEINKIKISNGRIWAATASGLASCPLDTVISDPSSWTSYPAATPELTPAVSGVGFIGETVYAYSGAYVLRLENDTLRYYKNLYYDVVSLNEYKGSIVFATRFRLFNLDGTEAYLQPSKTLNTVVCHGNSNSSEIIFCYKNEGIGLVNDQAPAELAFKPNSPQISIFSDIDVDKSGALWSTSEHRAENGIQRLSNGKWLNFLVDKNPEINNNSYYKVHALGDGRLCFSNWGSGAMIVTPAGDGFKFDTLTKNTGAPFADVQKDYIVAGESAEDAQGNLWIVNYGEATPGPILIEYTNEKKFFTFDNCNNAANRYYIGLAVDFYGTKWVASMNGGGLLYYNENRTPDNPNDDFCGNINTSRYPLLQDNSQSAIVTDKNGSLWVGTSSGLSEIRNPSAVLGSGSLIVRYVKLIGKQVINDIMVDALNNKWLATSTGVWVLNSDATKVLAIFNSENSPLVTDEIASLATDPNTGKVYIGTRQGLFEAMSLSVQAGESYDITCHPQPFVPGRDEEMVIDGLASASEVRILTIDGNIVRNFITNSRKAIWDGRDNEGRTVSSGVYLVAAFSADSKNSAVAKIAVINK